MFRADPKTVTRWASAGRIGSVRTPGGHRRFRQSEIQDLLTEPTVDSSLTIHELAVSESSTR
jgi:excisionase family DNA binding protein